MNTHRPSDHEIVDVLAKVARVNPDALPLAAQLLGVPPCPKCGYVKRDGHVCRTEPRP